MAPQSKVEPKDVLARMGWVGEAEGSASPAEWQAAARQIFGALETAVRQLESSGLCRGCGKPLGAYCLECAWPHRRRRERRPDT